MRVLHVIPSVSPQEGGPSFVVRQLVDGLSAAGVEAHVVSTIADGEAPDSAAEAGSGGMYWYAPRQSAFYSFSWPLHRWLANHVRDYDLVHIHSLFSFPSISAAYWSRRRRVPYIVRPLGTLNRWGFENRRPWLKTVSFRCLESRILRHAAAVHYTTHEEQVEAERLSFRHRPVVIPNPWELPTSVQSGNSFLSRFPALIGRTAILFLSRIHRKKGLDLLLLAFADLRKGHPEVVLVIAGNGEPDLIAELQFQAEKLHIADAVFWVGFLDRVEKLEALKYSAVFVLPSYSENFGVAVIEAMAAGVPVAVSDQVAVHTEVLRAGAGLVCTCSATSLAATLCRILADPDAARRMGASGSAFAKEQYSLPAITTRLLSVYESILGCQEQADVFAL